MVLLGLLRILQEAYHLTLYIWWDFDILHRRIYLVQFFLESICFLVEVLDQDSHVAEDVGVDDGSHGV